MVFWPAKKNGKAICVHPQIGTHTVRVTVLLMSQAVLDSQKTSVPGDLIAVPGATEKISFAKYNLTLSLSASFLEDSTQTRHYTHNVCECPEGGSNVPLMPVWSC